MTEVITLDLATSTGWARLRGDEITYGTYRLPSTGKDLGRFLVPFHDWLMLFAQGADHVFFEAPYSGKSQDAARKLFALAAMTEYVCHKLEVNCWDENISTVTKHFCGRCPPRRDEKKALTIWTCKAMGWNPKNDDEADALALLHLAVHKLRLKVKLPVGGVFGRVA